MNAKKKRWVRQALFTLGGMLAGLGYYYYAGCTSGNCPIASNPLNSMIYLGVVGWLLSGLFDSKECESGCNM